MGRAEGRATRQNQPGERPNPTQSSPAPAKIRLDFGGKPPVERPAAAHKTPVTHPNTTIYLPICTYHPMQQKI